MILKITLIIKTTHFIKLIRIPNRNRILLIKIFLNDRAKRDLIIINSLLFDISTFHYHLSALIFNIAELSTVLANHLSLLELRESFKTVYFWSHSVFNTLEFVGVFIWECSVFFFLLWLFIALHVVSSLFLILTFQFCLCFFFKILMKNVFVLVGLNFENVLIVYIIVLEAYCI